MDVVVRPGTDTRFPSVRVVISGQPAVPDERRGEPLRRRLEAEGTPADQVTALLEQELGLGVPLSDLAPLDTTKLTEREIALVFRKGETEAEMRDAIHRAVWDYLHPARSTTDDVADPTTLYGRRRIPDTEPTDR